MKKLLFLFIILLKIYSVAYTQVLTVSNQSNSPGQYLSLQDAINAATSGDTIYVHGSPFSYGSIVVNKRLTFIGPGYNPQGQFTNQAYINSVIFDTIIPSSSASGSKFIGLRFDNIAKKSIEFWLIHDITFEGCHIASSLNKSFISGNRWSFINCFFNFTGNNVNLDIGNYNNILFANNVFNFSLTNQPTFPALINSNKSTVIITNNLFTGNYVGDSFNSLSNAQISNNIFWGKSPLGATTSVYSNNLTYGTASPTLPPPGNTGQDNLSDVDPEFVNVSIGSYFFTFSYDFNLSPTSPAKNAGTDGTDIGIYGGFLPMPAFGAFTITGHPELPQVYYLQIQNNLLPLTSPLDISVKARKNYGVYFYTGEYFFDWDPGVGNGIPLALFAPTADTTLHLQILASSLQPGPHFIYFRFKDTLDRWGLHARMDFFSCDVMALADFSADTVCLGDPTTFINLSTGGDVNTLYRWDFNGDGVDDMLHTGIIGSGAPLNFTYLYFTGGVYNVRLITDNGGGCSDTIYRQVLVLAYPPVPTPVGEDSLCINSSNSIYAIPQLLGATSYSWQLIPTNAGSITVLQGDTAIEVDWENTFTGSAQIIAGAVYGSCSSPLSAPPSAPLTVLISTPSVGGVISVIDSTICLGDSTGIMSLSGHTGAVLWWEKSCNGGAWTPIPASSTTTYSEILPLSGICQYRVLVKNGFCDSVYSSVATLTINALPDSAGAITGPTQICEGQQTAFSVPAIPGAVSYTWTLPLGATIVSGHGTNSIFIHFNPGVTTGVVSVSASNACGYGASSYIVVTVNPSPFVFVTPHPDTTITCNTSVSFNGAVVGGTSPFSVQWTPAVLVNSPNTISTSTVNLTDTTIFILTITDSLGCAVISQVAVNVSCSPMSLVVSSSPTAICAGDSSVLTANASGGAQPYTYQWSSNPGTFNSASQSPVVNPTVTTTYTVTVTGGGQSVSAQTVVNVMPLPGPAGMIWGPSVVNYGQTGVNYSVPVIANASIYIWSVPQGFTIVSGQYTNSILVDIAINALTGEVSVYGSNSCGNGLSSSMLPLTILTGMSDNEDIMFAVHPTFTSGKVYVKRNFYTDGTLIIRLFNPLGAVIFEEYLTNETLQIFDFSCFVNGIYYLNISGNFMNKTVKLSIQK